MNRLETLQDRWRRMGGSRWVRVGGGILFGVVTLGWVRGQVEVSEVWPLLRAASPSYLLLGISSVSLNLLAKIIRWRVLLGKPGTSVPLRTLGGVTLSGQLVNAMIPGRLGDLARILIIGETTGKAFVLGTIALEKWLDTLAFLFLFLFALLWIPFPDWLEGSSWSLISLAVLGTVGLGGAVYFADALKRSIASLTRRLPVRIQRWVVMHLEPGFASLVMLRETKTWLLTVFWTWVIWLTAVLNNYAGMRALQVHLPFSVAAVLLIGLQVGIVAAASPGAIGVFEYICILTLTYWGVERTLALSVGLLLHGLVYLPLLVGGFWPLLDSPGKGPRRVE